MAKQLKEQTIWALAWSFFDKGGQQIIQFVFTILLARLLSPNQFGLLGALAIFMAVANLLQESGFSSALIRKKIISEKDYSSVFFFNVFISLACYLFLFIFSPYIASFYEQPILTNLSRFIFLSFLFNSLGIIQNVHLVREMNFKKNAHISLVSTLISGFVSVALAYVGFGVWSLACQMVLQAFFRTLFLWLSVRWYPSSFISIERLKSMAGYSSKLLLNSLFNQITANVSSMVIGRKFSMTDLGNYNQAFKFGNMPQSMIASSIQSVALPLLSKMHDGKDGAKKAFRKIVRVVCFLCFPVCVFTIIAAEPIVLFFFQEKWIGVVPILKVLVIGSSVVPLFYILSSLLQSLGKSGTLLYLEMFRNIFTLAIIVFTVRFGVNGLVLGTSCIAVISFFFAYYRAGLLINYSFVEILKDVLSYAIIAFFSYAPFYFLHLFINNNLLLITTQFCLGSVVYLLILKLLGSKVLTDLIAIFRSRKN